MGYTQDDFEEWLILIDFKMDYFTGEFAKEQKLKLLSHWMKLKAGYWLIIRRLKT